MDLNLLKDDMENIINTLLEAAELTNGDPVILGGSTSEIIGEDLGSATNMEVAETIVKTFIQETKKQGLYPVIQACEHINRALVVDRDYAMKHDLMPVNVLPVPEAGGGFATAAMDILSDPVVIERGRRISAGIDIGDVFIGMHLDPDRIGVVVRSEIKEIGKAHLSMIRTRARLIGGDRARHL